MNVLSLFDGISCGRVALERSGIKVDSYYASEIDKYAIQIAQKNYPDTIQLGDISNYESWDLPEIDMVIGGSPCQDLSVLKLNRQGLSGDKSGLFYKFVGCIERFRPQYFLLENNRSMPAEAKEEITSILGVHPIEINSALLSAQYRRRLYWTNIPGVEQPKDRKLRLNDIVQSEESKTGYECSDKLLNRTKGHLAVQMAKKSIKQLTQKSNCLTTGQRITNKGATTIQYPNGRYYILTPLECERLQTLPDGYTYGISNTQRYKAIGNGWTVDVIAHILRYINQSVNAECA